MSQFNPKTLNRISIDGTDVGKNLEGDQEKHCQKYVYNQLDQQNHVNQAEGYTLAYGPWKELHSDWFLANLQIYWVEKLSEWKFAGSGSRPDFIFVKNREQKENESNKNNRKILSEAKFESSSENHSKNIGEIQIESSSEKPSESNSEKQDESNSEKQVESSSENQGESSSEKQGENSSENQGESSSENQGESSSENQGDSSSENQGESSSEKQGESRSEEQVESSNNAGQTNDIIEAIEDQILNIDLSNEEGEEENSIKEVFPNEYVIWEIKKVWTTKNTECHECGHECNPITYYNYFVSLQGRNGTVVPLEDILMYGEQLASGYDTRSNKYVLVRSKNLTKCKQRAEEEGKKNANLLKSVIPNDKAVVYYRSVIFVLIDGEYKIDNISFGDCKEFK